jgi:hypothetical protein
MIWQGIEIHWVLKALIVFFFRARLLEGNCHANPHLERTLLPSFRKKATPNLMQDDASMKRSTY